MRTSLRRIARTRPQARPSSAWARPQRPHTAMAAGAAGFAAGALGAHQLARSDAIVSVSYTHLTLPTKA